ncbi:MAG: thioesterase family protein [Deltaproteobacteria bacterium]|nr:thioesterase family protein [Deltaproteobacteria bacterium]
MDRAKPDHSLFLEPLREMFENKIPFNRLLGMKVVSFEEDGACIRIDMREDFVGNFFLETLHGGVIFSVLDVVGGMTSVAGLIKKLRADLSKETAERFSKIGTIDMRIDFIRPGRGKYFLGTGTQLRTGNKVAVNRMELRNDEGELIAAGTGTYLVG